MSTSQTVDPEVLSTIQRTIDDYNLLLPGERVLVALSGGKDSFFTMRALRELGFRFTPVVVDIGTRGGWGRGSTESCAGTMDLNPLS